MYLSGLVEQFPEIHRRRVASSLQFDQLKRQLLGAEDRIRNVASVYATGSFGRGEASQGSDLDLFIVGSTSEREASESGIGKLSHLNEVLLKADLINATRAQGIPDFDGDGRYLVHYSVGHLKEALGTPEDDSLNTFTARLLLLLESQALLNESLYKIYIDQVIESYWRDYDDHKGDFIPAYLTNDILRLWRTFCFNYEARTQVQPVELKIKRKIKNYKLKFSRLLTCYSSILYLLAILQRAGTVTPGDARDMAEMCPIDRLLWILSQQDFANSHGAIRQLLWMYNGFLETTSAASQLFDIFSDRSRAAELFLDAVKFGNVMHLALRSVGEESRLYRLLIV
jgi:predicted nucleotidyltransferase